MTGHRPDLDGAVDVLPPSGGGPPPAEGSESAYAPSPEAAALLATYASWRARRPTPAHTVAGYEHALYVQWCGARWLESHSPERDPDSLQNARAAAPPSPPLARGEAVRAVVSALGDSPRAERGRR